MIIDYFSADTHSVIEFVLYITVRLSGRPLQRYNIDFFFGADRIFVLAFIVHSSNSSSFV